MATIKYDERLAILYDECDERAYVLFTWALKALQDREYKIPPRVAWKFPLSAGGREYVEIRPLKASPTWGALVNIFLAENSNVDCNLHPASAQELRRMREVKELVEVCATTTEGNHG